MHVNDVAILIAFPQRFVAGGLRETRGLRNQLNGVNRDEIVSGYRSA